MKRTTVKVLSVAVFSAVLLLAFLMMVGTYFGLFDPADGLGYWPLFGGIQPGGTKPGGDGGGSSSGTGGISGGVGSFGDADELEGIIIFSATAEEDTVLYFKYGNFLNFTGQEWTSASACEYLLYDWLSADYLHAYTSANMTAMPVQINPLMGIHVLPCYMVDGGNVTESDVAVPGSGTASYTAYYTHYNASESIPFGSHVEAYGNTYNKYAYNTYLDVDDETRHYMEYLIYQNGWYGSQAGIVDTVAQYIQNAATYNLEYDKALDEEENSVIAFLETYKEGKCSHYASAATLLFRSLGIPARYTVGYAVAVQKGKEVDVTAADCHAWVEVYEEGRGWRVVEVTGGQGNGSGSGSGSNDGNDGPGGDSGGVNDLSTNIGGSNGGGTGGSGSGPILKVFAQKDDSLYLKYHSLHNFQGQSWTYAPEYGKTIDGLYSADYLYGLTAEKYDHSPVQITPLTGMHVLPYYMFAGDTCTSSDVSITGSGTEAYITWYLSDIQQFRDLPSEYCVFEQQYRDFVYSTYLDVDAETRKYMQKLISQNGWNASQSDIIEAVARYIQNAAAYNAEYDPALDEEANGVIAFLETYKEGKCSHYASAATLLFRALGIPARYTQGFLVNAKAGKSVEVSASDAHAWVEVYIDGQGWRMVEVTGSDNSGGGENPGEGSEEGVREFVLRPQPLEKKHDGTPLFHNGQLIGFDDWAKQGYVYKAEVPGSRTELGSQTVEITDLQIYDPSGVLIYDMLSGYADNVEVRLGDGRLQVYWERLEFTSESATKVYDGTPLRIDAGDCRLSSGELPKYYYFTVYTDAQRTNVGIGAASFHVRIFSDKGDDVTDWFLISKNPGKLTILPRTLILEAGSATKEYDGMPLTENSILILEGEEMTSWGDYIAQFTIQGSQTNPGKSDNVITDVVIRNANGEDVTGNYAIVFIVGTLRVIYIP